MQPITPSQIRRILEITDAYGIHREAVTIPLAREGTGRLERIDGPRIQITAPEGNGFDAWITGLTGQLGELDLAGIQRADEEED